MPLKAASAASRSRVTSRSPLSGCFYYPLSEYLVNYLWLACVVQFFAGGIECFAHDARRCIIKNTPRHKGKNRRHAEPPTDPRNYRASIGGRLRQNYMRQDRSDSPRGPLTKVWDVAVIELSPFRLILLRHPPQFFGNPSIYCETGLSGAGVRQARPPVRRSAWLTLRALTPVLRNPTQGGHGFRRKADSIPMIADSL